MLLKVQKIALWSWIKYLLGGLFGLGVIFNYLGYSVGNFLFCKSQAIKLLHMLSLLFFLEPILWALSKKKKKTFFSNVLDRIGTNCNSLANGRNYCMAYNIGEMKDTKNWCIIECLLIFLIIWWKNQQHFWNLCVLIQWVHN